MGGRTGSASRLRLELDVDPPRPARCEELVRVDLADLADDVRLGLARSCSPTPSAAAADARRRRGGHRAHAPPRPPRRQGPLRIPSPSICEPTTMANLIYSAIASLDGYIADEDGNFDWAAPDEEVHAFVNDLERPVGTYLYGRRMYETMAVWETMALDDEPPVMRDFAEIWRAADKVVYSTTLADASTAPHAAGARLRRRRRARDEGAARRATSASAAPSSPPRRSAPASSTSSSSSWRPWWSAAARTRCRRRTTAGSRPARRAAVRQRDGLPALGSAWLARDLLAVDMGIQTGGHEQL